jgi:hypothetical protein
MTTGWRHIPHVQVNLDITLSLYNRDIIYSFKDTVRNLVQLHLSKTQLFKPNFVSSFHPLIFSC